MQRCESQKEKESRVAAAVMGISHHFSTPFTDISLGSQKAIFSREGLRGISAFFVVSQPFGLCGFLNAYHSPWAMWGAFFRPWDPSQDLGPSVQRLSVVREDESPRAGIFSC